MRCAPPSGRAASAAALALAALFAAPARSDSYGLLRAYVSDPDGRPLKSTLVRITPPGLTATSDAQGIIRIRIRARTYALSASRAGCETDVLTGVELPAGGVTDVVLVLRPSGASWPAGAAAAP
ncbi:MAG: carboxypeptidase-like regulatory domain-containing protein [Thermoanaerobaculia bacterium]